jgi:hypothetical protein
MSSHPLSTRRTRGLAAAVLVFSCPLAAAAADGRIEIDHARAIAGKVTSGDTPGYPVILNAPGSFVLTGPLTPPNKTAAILITARDVHLDLNGFSIQGSFTCAPGACTPIEGTGIATSLGDGGNTWVGNGFVRGFGTDCVQLSSSSRVVGLHVFDCGNDGIEVADDCDVSESTIQRVGRHGIFFSKGVGTYRENVVSDVASVDATGLSVFRGTAIRGNVCEDHRCSRRAMRRYYLTTGIATGSQTLTACAGGFHMASALELRDTSALEYAIELGDVEGDSGRGPISNNSGWVRTGLASSATENCSNWTSAAAAQTGFKLILRAPANWNVAATQLSPWQASAAGACNLATNVWCVED